MDAMILHRIGGPLVRETRPGPHPGRGLGRRRGRARDRRAPVRDRGSGGARAVSAAADVAPHAALISIAFGVTAAVLGFGSFRVRTPLSIRASISSGFVPGGSSIVREKAP